MNKLLAGLVGLMMMASVPSFGACIKDAAGLPVETISKSDAMNVLNQIGGFKGLTGKWTTDGGSFDFSVATGKVNVTYTIGKVSKAATVVEVCTIDATSLKVVAKTESKLVPVYMKITGNPTKIQLGFSLDDTSEFSKQ